MSKNLNNQNLNLQILSTDELGQIWGGRDVLAQRETVWSRDTFGVGSPSATVASGTFRSSGGTTGSVEIKVGPAQSSGQHDPKTGATSSGPAIGISAKF